MGGSKSGLEKLASPIVKWKLSLVPVPVDDDVLNPYIVWHQHHSFFGWYPHRKFSVHLPWPSVDPQKYVNVGKGAEIIGQTPNSMSKVGDLIIPYHPYPENPRKMDDHWRVKWVWRNQCQRMSWELPIFWQVKSTQIAMFTLSCLFGCYYYQPTNQQIMSYPKSPWLYLVMPMTTGWWLWVQ